MNLVIHVMTGVDGKIILECILRKCGGECGQDASGSEQGQVASSEHHSERSGSIKGGEFVN
jgi:hypothetical protein